MGNLQLVVTAVRWAARTAAVLFLATILAFALGESVPNPFVISPRELLASAAMLTMVVGLLVAWIWERIGGTMILCGFAAFAIVNHGIHFNLVFGSLPVMGLLFLLCGCLRHRGTSPS